MKTTKLLLGLVVAITIGFLSFHLFTTQLSNGELPQLQEVVEEKPKFTEVEVTDPVLIIVNRYRTEAGLKPLRQITELEKSATFKANKMLELNCWAHDCGNSWVDDFNTSGLPYLAGGENLAQNYGGDYERLVKAWVDSPKHHDVMFGDYEFAGIGYAHGHFLDTANNEIVALHVAKL